MISGISRREEEDGAKAAVSMQHTRAEDVLKGSSGTLEFENQSKFRGLLPTSKVQSFGVFFTFVKAGLKLCCHRE